MKRWAMMGLVATLPAVVAVGLTVWVLQPGPRGDADRTKTDIPDVTLEADAAETVMTPPAADRAEQGGAAVTEAAEAVAAEQTADAVPPALADEPVPGVSHATEPPTADRAEPSAETEPEAISVAESPAGAGAEPAPEPVAEQTEDADASQPIDFQRLNTDVAELSERLERFNRKLIERIAPPPTTADRAEGDGSAAETEPGS
ncbi:MAG: hypothetical protein AAGG38_07640 [Planctomycetota bacterium]